MQFSVKHLRDNPYNGDHEIVSEGTEYGFWRVVEHTGAGWFPLPGFFDTRLGAEKAKRKYEEKFENETAT